MEGEEYASSILTVLCTVDAVFPTTCSPRRSELRVKLAVQFCAWYKVST